ncbi:permease prefix domain 1-containing protein [Streptococcus pacificus]|uniref:DUF1129 family protein n=1 Tax=Streptococcus pacificus TaxID=2740577 RepID=A0ABS0ZJM4_9STRE|nr:permease prefix domain 1-containing protein [Streptococcus pacificus]MBJ8326198.1 hypothetical protein [Streptococcus pacificus]
MNNKIKNYVEGLFVDIPRSKKANELKEELLSNMSDRFDDYVKEGKSENEAYSLVIASLGDIDELLSEITPTEEFFKEARYFRDRNAKYSAIGVSLYIVGLTFLIGFGGLGYYLGDAGFYAIVGVLVMLFITAIATALLVYSSKSTPLEYKDYNEKKNREYHYFNEKQKRALKLTKSIYWPLVICLYFFVSFTTRAWHITWMIGILAGVFEAIIKTIIEVRFEDE